MQPDLPQHIAGYRRGDPASAELLARRACQIALRTAAAVLGSREQAADIAQDVAVEALRGLRTLREPDRFDAWVHRITVRHTVRALRRRRDEALTAAPEPWHEPDDAGRLATREVVRHALAALPERQRIALALRYVHDLSEEEVADALACRPGTAASLLSRGRELLRTNPLVRDLASRPLEGGMR
jgi:RNA polymerase sigma factor (sigma-70 family)